MSVLVSVLSRKLDQAIDRRSLVFRCEMGVPHDHLECPVPEQLCNRAQIDPGHNKSTGKRMAVAMPRKIKHLRVIECCRKPPARALQGIPRARRRKDRRGPRLCVVAFELPERSESH